MREWFAEQLQDPALALVQAQDIRPLIKEQYDILFGIYDDIPKTPDVDADQLWSDWLIYTIYIYTERFLPAGERMEFVHDCMVNTLNLTEADTSMFQQYYLKNTRNYLRYCHNAFDYGSGDNGQFYIRVFRQHHNEPGVCRRFLNAFRSFQLYLTYYLYLIQSTDSQFMTWQIWLKNNLTNLERMSEDDWINSKNTDDNALIHPVYGRGGRRNLHDFRYFRHMLLFRFTGTESKMEEEITMIEQLYLQIHNGQIEAAAIESIIPDTVAKQTAEGKLPEFTRADVKGLQTGEQVHYTNHTVLYEGRSSEDGFIFTGHKGIITFTDQRILYHGFTDISLHYDHVDRVIQYDALPEILEICAEGRSYYFALGENRIAYEVLKLISDKRKGLPEDKSEVTYTYEQLIDAADLQASVFAFECIMNNDLPNDLLNPVESLIVKLRGMQKTIDKYPDRKEDISRFVRYYTPEVIGLFNAYLHYQDVCVDKETLERLYTQITEAVLALNDALEQKILSMYKLETMDTSARASALKDILAEDGYGVQK